MSTHQNYKKYIDVREIHSTALRLKFNARVKQAWEKGDPYLIYDEVVKILPDMDFATFDDGQQYRTIFHENFREACNEIAHVMAGVS